jgi:hypothetical protein
MPQTKYEFFHDRPGLFLEIYLPKKAQYQPLLFRVLNEGFDLRIVRGHFRSDKAKDIRRFLQRNQELRNFSPAAIRNFQSVFSGYSLYEVDGTFEGNIQERTQVVRVIFVPPVEQLAGGLKIARSRQLFYARQFLRFWARDTADYYEFRRHTVPLAPGEGKLVQRLSRWLYYVGLFANGYLLYEIGAGIRELHRSGVIRQLERELWVTSFRDFALNQMKLVSRAS